MTGTHAPADGGECSPSTTSVMHESGCGVLGTLGAEVGVVTAAPPCTQGAGMCTPLVLADGVAAEGMAVAPGAEGARGDLDAMFADVVTRIESQLSAVSGHDDQEAERHAGRAAGVSFRWSDPLGRDVATDRLRSTPLSRAWSRSAGWLADLLLAPGAWRAHQLRRWLLKYPHDLGADGLQQHGRAFL